MKQSADVDLKCDILPSVEFETMPVTSCLPPYPESYSEVVRLNANTDVDCLKKDFLDFDKTRNYFRSRAKFFKDNFRETVKAFEMVGFHNKVYQAYPMRAIETNALLDTVGAYTRSFLESLKVTLFRQQYVVAKRNWSTTFHIDYPDFKIYGYRLLIPIDPAFLGFQENIYYLEPGSCYFVNVAKKHRGFTTLNEERAVIMAQMASDKLILEGKNSKPMHTKLIPKEFRNVSL